MAVVESTAKTFAPRPFLAAIKQFAAGADTPRAYLERCLAALAEHEPAVRMVPHPAPTAANERAMPPPAAESSHRT